MTASKYLVPLVGVILLFLFVIKPLMKAVTSSAPTVPQQIALPQSVAELQKSLTQTETSSKQQLIDWAKKNPKDATNLVKGWIEEKS